VSFRPRAIATLVALVSLFAILPAASAAAAVTPSTTPVTSVNLADYGLVARHALPSALNPLGGDTSCASSGSGDVLGDEASAVAYDPNGNGGAGSLFILGDGGACVVQTSLTGTYIDSMTLATGDSAQGTAFYDTEGLTYVGQDSSKPQLVMTEERYRQLDEFDYTPSTTLTLGDAQAVKLGTTIGNIGLEGVAYDPATSNAAGCTSQTVNSVTGNFCQGFVVVKEKQPEDIFQTNVDWGARGAQSTDPAQGTATNGGPNANEGAAGAPTSLFPPADAGVNDFSDVFALSNIASLNSVHSIDPNNTGTPRDGDLLIDSQESGEIELINRSGVIQSHLDLLANPASGLNVVDETHEGVAMDQNGNLYVDSEDGAGPNDPELEVYAPTSDPDMSPTAISLASTKGTLPSTTTTANGPVKLSELSVTDGDSDGIGSDVYTVTATDGGGHDAASLFKADHTGLYLATGASLVGVPSPVTIHVTVKDPNAIDASSFPNGVTSGAFTLTVNSVSAPTGAESKVIVSEVDPSGSGSGNNTYGEDWFELTNTGTQPVDLTGWSADDSHEVAGKYPLFGVSTIDPGQSVVFVQADTAMGAATTPAQTVAAFKSDWGLSSNVQVGYYSDSDGLSQSGDEVNVYDAGENFVTGVSFGASENQVSFDNSAGITGAIGAFSDSGGDDGSITDSHGETGSPGFAHIAPTVAVTEVDPAGSAAAYGSDWFELTNYGSQPINMSGWTMDDSSAAQLSSVTMTEGSGSSTLAPGKSIIFAEDPADSSVMSGPEATATLNSDLPAVESAFEGAWFPGGAPSGFLFGVYGGKGVGLSNSGDGVTIFDGNGDVVDEVQFSGTAVFENPGLVGVGGSTTEAAAPALTTVAIVGVAGAFTNTATAPETGSPGVYVPTTAITEIDPAGSAASYGSDWFELTNTGPLAVDLTGWTVDDSSDAFSSSVATTVGTQSPILAPGQSIVYAEDPGDTAVTSGSEDVATLNADLPTVESAFNGAWFPSGTPSGLLFGVYGGKGVGLSTSGDGVNLFNAGGTPIVGVTFGAAPTGGATFDNSTGTLVASVRGVRGARPSASGAEIGSPGTIAPDTTAPTLTVAGNNGTYAYTDTVNITCTAADDQFGSGIQTACTGINAPASSFGVGTHTVTLSATDYAGNVGTSQVAFTVLAQVSTGGGGTTTTTTTTTTPPPTTTTTTTLGGTSTGKPAPAPKLGSLGSTTTEHKIESGLSTTVTKLKAKSKVSLAIRAGNKTLGTFKATASKNGTVKVKFHLSKKLAAKYHGKKLTLRFTVTDAKGHKHTLSKTLKIS
jgi:uncharacterized protein YjiK